MKVTRRSIAQMLADAAALPAPAAPQTPQEDPVTLARRQFERNSLAMEEVKIPISTEPPFHFKA